MTKHEVWVMLQQYEKKFERKKFKRMLLLILIYSVISFVLMYWKGEIDTSSILMILAGIGLSIVFGFIAFWVNALIWSQVMRVTQEENAALEYLKKKYRETEDIKPPKELV